jgi:preprotein translocase subunit SecE
MSEEEKDAPEQEDKLPPPEADAATETPAEASAPAQLGAKRFVYAAYFGGAIIIAFLFSKFASLGWYRLDQWKPTMGLGEPKEELIMVVGAALGGALAVFYWRKEDARKYVEEVADELGKVTWPSKKEVTNSTGVVVVTTLVATVFFALMDRFWGFVTNLVYGGT